MGDLERKKAGSGRRAFCQTRGWKEGLALVVGSAGSGVQTLGMVLRRCGGAAALGVGGFNLESGDLKLWERKIRLVLVGWEAGFWLAEEPAILGCVCRGRRRRCR